MSSVEWKRTQLDEVLDYAVPYIIRQNNTIIPCYCIARCKKL